MISNALTTHIDELDSFTLLRYAMVQQTKNTHKKKDKKRETYKFDIAG